MLEKCAQCSKKWGKMYMVMHWWPQRLLCPSSCSCLSFLLWNSLETVLRYLPPVNLTVLSMVQQVWRNKRRGWNETPWVTSYLNREVKTPVSSSCHRQYADQGTVLILWYPHPGWTRGVHIHSQHVVTGTQVLDSSMALMSEVEPPVTLCFCSTNTVQDL